MSGSQSYAEAQIDTVPPYWETTVVAPSEPGEFLVDDLPTGSVLVFVFNLFASFFFQFIGFVITYFLSTTHAARYGARAGLGLTFIQYGAYWRAAQNIEANPSKEEQQQFALWNGTMSAPVPDPLQPMANKNGTETVEPYDSDIGFGGKDWLALFFMTFGEILFRMCDPGGHHSSPSQLTETLSFLSLPLSQTPRLGPSLHFLGRVLESEKVGDVHQGVFAPSGTHDPQRPCSRSSGSKEP